MTDITRDDLHRYHPTALYWTKVTDEEFDRLAREWLIERGGFDMYLAFTMEWITENPAKALRALLTDECPHEECVNGYLGEYEHVDPYTGEHLGNELIKHEVCGGRGWLPKDGLETDQFDDTGPVLLVPIDWLEADDEA